MVPLFNSNQIIIIDQNADKLNVKYKVSNRLYKFKK